MIHLPNVAILFFFISFENRTRSVCVARGSTTVVSLPYTCNPRSARVLRKGLASSAGWRAAMDDEEEDLLTFSLSPPHPFPSSLSPTFFSFRQVPRSPASVSPSAPGRRLALQEERGSRTRGGSTSSRSRNDSRRGWQRTDAARHKPVPRGHPPRILLSPPVVDASACWRVLCCRHRRLSKYSNTGGVGGEGGQDSNTVPVLPSAVVVWSWCRLPSAGSGKSGWALWQRPCRIFLRSIYLPGQNVSVNLAGTKTSFQFFFASFFPRGVCKRREHRFVQEGDFMLKSSFQEKNFFF